MRGRVKETAILQTLGFSRPAIGILVGIEGILLGLAGGLLGVFSSALFFHFKSFTLGNEGLTLALQTSLDVQLKGLLVAFLMGFLASLFPAWKATARPLVDSLNS